MPGIRQHDRVDVARAAIRVDVWSRDQGAVVALRQGIVSVLSQGGLFVRTTAPFALGTGLGLRFTLPTTGTEIICSGIVRDRRPDGLGIEFTTLMPRDEELVHAAVLRAQSGRPLRSIAFLS